MYGERAVYNPCQMRGKLSLSVNKNLLESGTVIFSPSKKINITELKTTAMFHKEIIFYEGRALYSVICFHH